MDTPKTIDELDEMRARALYANHPAGFWLKQPTAFDDLPAEVRRDVLTEARIIREADERAGLVAAPVDMTEEMQQAALLVTIKGDHGWVCKLVAAGSKCYADYPLCDLECSGEPVHTLRDDSPVDVYRAVIAASPFAKKEC